MTNDRTSRLEPQSNTTWRETRHRYRYVASSGILLPLFGTWTDPLLQPQGDDLRQHTIIESPWSKLRQQIRTGNFRDHAVSRLLSPVEEMSTPLTSHSPAVDPGPLEPNAAREMNDRPVRDWNATLRYASGLPVSSCQRPVVNLFANQFA